MSAATSARSVRHKENVKPVRALQRVLYRSAKQNRDRRFHAVFDKVARSDVLEAAWLSVRANGGAAGVDGITVKATEPAGVNTVLEQLAAELHAGTYRPGALRRVDIPKPGQPGKTRPLGIPTVRDRIVMTAAKIVLEPIFEADFLPSSFGFRPGRSAHKALETIREAANAGRNWVLDADVADCFGSIDHDALMSQLATRVSDRKMLKLLRAWLRAGVLRQGRLCDSVSGTPQGSPISPLLANIALHRLDKRWQQGGQSFGVLVRYADDFVVICSNEQRAHEAQRRVEIVLSELGLQLNPAKTSVVDLTKGKAGFDFLGFHLRKVAHWKNRNRWYLQRWPSTRAMRAVRARIKDATHRRFVGNHMDEVVGRLNPVLRGWGGYFRYGNSAAKFSAVDSYVHERLAIFASNKHGRSGRNWASHYNGEWLKRLGVYRLTGTVRHISVHA